MEELERRELKPEELQEMMHRITAMARAWQGLHVAYTAFEETKELLLKHGLEWIAKRELEELIQKTGNSLKNLAGIYKGLCGRDRVALYDRFREHEGRAHENRP